MRWRLVRGLAVAALLVGACSSNDDTDDGGDAADEPVESTTTTEASTTSAVAAEPSPCPVEEGDDIPTDIGATGCTLDGELVEWESVECSDGEILVRSDLGFGYEGLQLVTDLSAYDSTLNNFCV